MNKQESLEEAAEKYDENDPNDEYGKSYRAFIEGGKWQKERSYSEEDCYRTLHYLMTEITLNGLKINDDMDLKEWFEQFKKTKL
jgi:hypothetical protein